MPIFNGPNLLITLDDPTAGVLNISVEIDLYSVWKEWTIGRYLFDTETDVNGTTERITFTNHSLYTGQTVRYRNDGGAENIGLVDGTEYFVRADFSGVYNRNEFELYDTKANAEAGPSTTGRLDLTASGGGSGETHRITADNAKFINAFRTIGGDPLTPGVEAGPYFFLQNQDILGGDGWRIISTDEDQTINYQGNLVGENATKSLIVVTPGKTVLHLGLQPVTQRVDEILELGQIAEYQGGVWIDTINGVTGTLYPAGTQAQPVDNLAQATTIANNLNFETFFLRGSITLTQALTDWRVLGVASEVNDIIAFAGQDISGSVFTNCVVSGAIGTITKDIDLTACRVGAITGYQGTMARCGLEDTILLAPGQTNVVNCYSAAPGVQVVEFDFQGNNLIDLFIRGLLGVVRISNSSNAGSTANIDLVSGIIGILSSWTAGSIAIRGVGSYNNSSSIQPNDRGLIDQEDILIIKQMVAGNATVSPDALTVTVYDEDGITVIATFSLSADGKIRARTS